MSLKNLPSISETAVEARGVSKLADRPNLTGQYGTSGLSATALKAWFDQLAKYIATKLSETNAVFASEEAADYIRICLEGANVESLGDLITTFENGTFAADILKVTGSTGDSKESLQTVLSGIAQSISAHGESLTTLGGNISKVSSELDTLKKKVDNLQESGGNVVVDDEVTQDGQNPVSSKGIYDFVQDALQDALYQPIKINSFTASTENPDDLELSASGSATVTLNWSLSRTPATQTLSGAAIDASNRNATKTVSTTSIGTREYTLKVTDSKGNYDTKTTYVTVCNKIYYGVAETPSSYGDTWARNNLTGTLSNSRQKTFTVTAGENEYIYYAVPTELGECTFTVGVFTGGFNKVGTYQFKNSKGYTESYYLYKSEQPNLGNTTVEVS